MKKGHLPPPKKGQNPLAKKKVLLHLCNTKINWGVNNSDFEAVHLGGLFLWKIRKRGKTPCKK